MDTAPPRLLVPTDVSATADRALHDASDLATALRAEVELVRVCNAGRTLYHPDGTPTGFDAEQAAAEETARARLRALGAPLEARGLHVRTAVLGPTETATGLLDAPIRADLVLNRPARTAPISSWPAGRAPAPTRPVPCSKRSPMLPGAPLRVFA